MNNIKNTITAILLILSIGVSTAAEPIITGSESKTFTVDLADWASQEVSVTITDASGTILINDDIAGTLAAEYFDVNALTQGRAVTVTILDAAGVVFTQAYKIN